MGIHKEILRRHGRKKTTEINVIKAEIRTKGILEQKGMRLSRKKRRQVSLKKT